MRYNNKDFLNKDYFLIQGRYYIDDALHLYNSTSGITFDTDSKEIKLIIKHFDPRGESSSAYISVIINNDIYNKEVHELKAGMNEISLKFDEGVKRISILKNNEAIDSYLEIYELDVDGKIFKNDKVYEDALIIGDSTTAGFGNLGNVDDPKTTKNSDGILDFCYLALQELNYVPHVFSASGWGVSGSIWTKPKKLRLYDHVDQVCVNNNILYDHKLINPKVILFSLGTNDATYINEIPDFKIVREYNFIKTYITLIEKYFTYYPDAIIYMIYLPLGEGLIKNSIVEIYNELKIFHKNIKLIELDCDQKGCSYHPSLASHLKMKEELKNIIKKGIN